ncbi:MAG: TCR/Tet family MFS transporter [Pseudomonadota bacterium]
MVHSRHAVPFVFVTVLIDMIGFGIVLPVLPGLIMEITGESLAQAAAYSGFLLTAYALLQFFFAPVLGSLSDRFGRRPVLLCSLFMYAVNYCLAGLAGSLLWLFAGRIMTGIAGATHATANALVADITPPEQRAQSFGLLGMAIGLGFIFGPALGGLLGELGPRAPFYAAAALALLNCIYGFFMLPETLPPEQRRAFDWRRANPFGALSRIAEFPGLMGLAIVMLFYNLGHHVYPSVWAYFGLERFGWGSSEVGLSLTAVGVMMAISQGGLIRVVVPRIGPARTALLAFFAAFAAYLGFAFVQTIPALAMLIMLSAIGNLLGPSVQSIMSNQVPQNEQGELQGVLASLSSVGAIIGPLLMTQLFARYSDTEGLYLPGAPFLAAACLTLGALLLFAYNCRTEIRTGVTAKPTAG